jgi:hypothetical protein
MLGLFRHKLFEISYSYMYRLGRGGIVGTSGKMGFTSPVSGNHSFRIQNENAMWITPSGIPRYNLHEKDLVKVQLQSGEEEYWV